MKLASRRKELGLTCSKAAEKLGISQAYLSQLETGKRNINSAMIKKFAEVYSISEYEIKMIANELKENASISNHWINFIKINNEPLREAFQLELKYLPLKNNDDSLELEIRLINFIDKNILYSIKNELNQDKKLLEYFVE
jgi:transcriptional regulator with XRE-family HTH domain